MSIAPGVTCPRKIATGSSTPTNSPPSRSTPASLPKKRAGRLKRKEEPSYQGTFTGAKRYVLHTFANTQSALTRKRVSQFLISTECPLCHGKRLRRESLSVKFAGLDIADMSALSLIRLAGILRPTAEGTSGHAQEAGSGTSRKSHRRAAHRRRIWSGRIAVMLDLGLGYLSMERSTPTLSPGELQRLRLATQVRSNLFGVVYVLDEPSAGLHPADTEALLAALDRLKASGNSLFVVEHDLDVIRRADWIVDIGPAAGEQGGCGALQRSTGGPRPRPAIPNSAASVRTPAAPTANAALPQELAAPGAASRAII